MAKAFCIEEFGRLVRQIPFAIGYQKISPPTGAVSLNKAAELQWQSRGVPFLSEEDLKKLRAGENVFTLKAGEENSSLHCVLGWTLPFEFEGGELSSVLYISLINVNEQEGQQRLMDFYKALSDEKAKHHTEIAQRVAHEVNNPLAIIRGRANQLRRLLSSLNANDEAIKILASISEIAQKTSKNIDRFSDTLNSEYATFSEPSPQAAADSSSPASVPTPEHPREKSSHHPEFFHDLLNSLAIAQGKTRQVMKSLDVDKNPQSKHELQQRLNSAFEALKKIEKQVLEEAQRFKKVA